MNNSTYTNNSQFDLVWCTYVKTTLLYCGSISMGLLNYGRGFCNGGVLIKGPLWSLVSGFGFGLGLDFGSIANFVKMHLWFHTTFSMETDVTRQKTEHLKKNLKIIVGELSRLCALHKDVSLNKVWGRFSTTETKERTKCLHRDAIYYCVKIDTIGVVTLYTAHNKISKFTPRGVK